ncbi:DUF2946 family protein [Pseudoroseomonas globiformis]|uniref:DUF2946 family protein n=1 Tax=Teichococcus globiformis TaxID=2307229 RepID=A0ABV7FTZ3_9PROT
MTDRGRHLLRILTTLLLVQWVAALEPGLRALVSVASAQAVELCSSSGQYRTVLLDPDGREVPQHEGHPGCPLCRHAPPIGLPAPSAISLGLVAASTMDYPPARRNVLPPPPRGPPQLPRGPPVA